MKLQFRKPSPGRSTSRLVSGDHDDLAYRLLPAEGFVRALCLERKRAERSRRPFLLVLLDPGAPTDSAADNPLEKAIPALGASLRETDVLGWYPPGHVLGIVCAELGGADRATALGRLRAKLTAVLQETLPAGQRGRVRVSFHWFPEDPSDPGDGTPEPGPLYPDLTDREARRRVAYMVKRALDVLGSVVILLLLSPLLVAVAAAVKLSSPGPVLFRQVRVGRYGRPFTFLKFRSMHVANDPRIHREFVTRFIEGAATAGAVGGDAPAVYKITVDPRVTRIGRLLRLASIDELPQLFNVLRGEMSLVGPRPPIPYELDAYDVWHRRRFLEARPGITGLWQVKGRSRLRFDEMVRLDLAYAGTWSLWLDLKILVLTPRAVMSGQGAY
jgi:lipopolysaccharide/colanic/teichoic acid biosynthesis glycosyltransferase